MIRPSGLGTARRTCLAKTVGVEAGRQTGIGRHVAEPIAEPSGSECLTLLRHQERELMGRQFVELALQLGQNRISIKVPVFCWRMISRPP